MLIQSIKYFLNVALLQSYVLCEIRIDIFPIYLKKYIKLNNTKYTQRT